MSRNLNKKPLGYTPKDIKKYNYIKPEIEKFITNTKNIPSMKSYPLETDYEQGWFYRYFIKRVNDTNYFEISKDTYNAVLNKDSKYDYNLYQVGRVMWHLVRNVFKENALSLEKTEREFKNISYLFPILNEFQRPNLQNQDNLYTSGGELYKSDGTEYIGEYHIHTTMGPMEGSTHMDTPHSKLYYINQLPTPNNTDYEDFLKTYPPSDIPTEIPVATPLRGEIQPTTKESYNCVSVWGAPPTGYTGYVNSDGQAPLSSNCIDPGDGTGTYSYDTYGDSTLNECQSVCDGTSETFGIGCLLHFDPNFCSTCTIPDNDLCEGNYSHSVENFNPDQEQGWYTCFCGNYEGIPYYSQICC